MFRKYIPIVLVLLAALFLVGACTSSEVEYATEEQVSETNVPEETDIPEVTDESSPACLTQLEVMLNDDEVSEDDFDAPEADKEYILVTYQVSGDEISSPKYEKDVPEEFLEYQNDTENHEYLWKFFTDIIPAEQRKMIGEFVVFSDGYANVIGAVDEASTPNTWTLEMDAVDSRDLPTLATTLIHEFAHMLTLGDSQLEAGAASCSTYLSLDGCTKSDSYINAFYNAFWTDIHEEWSSMVLDSDGAVDEDAVLEFYDLYPDQFLTDYAPTGPEEDIAESWIYFIFGPMPAGDTIAEQKILFFYDYPELVELRQQTINGLCQYTQK